MAGDADAVFGDEVVDEVLDRSCLDLVAGELGECDAGAGVDVREDVEA